MLSRRTFAGLLTSALVTRGWAQAGAPGDVTGRLSVMLGILTRKGITIEQNLEDVAKAGYRHVGVGADFWNLSDAERANATAKMASLGITVDTTGGIRAGFADPAGGEAFLDQVRNRIAGAQQIKCSRIIMLSGRKLPDATDEAQRAASIAALKRAAALLESAGMDGVIEPIDRLENPTCWMDGVEEGFRLVRAVGSPRLKVLYDLYHEQRTHGNLIEKLEKNIDQVGLIHVADVPGRHEPGTGEMDYGNIYRKLKELKYTGIVAMEFYPSGYTVEGLRKARLQAERELA